MASNTRSSGSGASTRSGSPPRWIVTGAALAAAIAAASPLGIVPPTDTSLLLLATAALYAGWYVLRGSKRFGDRRVWRVLLAIFALLAAASVSTLASTQLYTGILGAPASSLGLVMWVAVAGVAMWAAFNAGGVRSVLSVAAPILLITQLASGVFQRLGGGQAIGTLSNSTFLGQLAVLLLPLSVSLAWRRGKGWQTASVFLVAIVGLVLAWFGSGASAAICLAFGGLLAWMRWMRPELKAPPIPHSVRGAVSALVAVAGTLVAPLIAIRITPDGSQLFERFASRPYLWDMGQELIAGSPLIGYGPNSFRVAAARVAPDAITIAEGYQTRSFGSMAADPHNLLVLIGVELGVVGLAICCWLAFEVARNWVKQSAIDTGGHQWLVWSIAGYTLTLALAPVSLQTLLPAAVVLGASLRPEMTSPQAGKVGRGRFSLVALSAIVILAASVVGMHAGARIWIRSSADPLKVAQRASAAAALASSDPFLSFIEARSWAAVGTDSTRTRAVEASLRAVEREPDNPFYLTDAAFFLGEFAADRVAALEYFAEAESLYPASLDIPLYRGRLLVDSGEAEAAASDVERALYLGSADPGVQDLSMEFDLATEGTR